VGVLGLGCIERPVGTAADFEGGFLSTDFVDAAVGTDSGLVGIEIVDFDQVGSGASAIAEKLEGRAEVLLELVARLALRMSQVELGH
jgi:hypothetical protein